MALQVILRIFSAHFELRAQVIASKKDGKHGSCGQTVVVGWPCHARKWQVDSVFDNVSLMCKSRTARVQLSDVEADHLQCPRWSTISSCPSRPHVLMWINQETDVVSLAYAHDFANVVQILLVITAGTFMFDSLPRHQQAHKSEPARLNAAEVLVGSVEWKWSSDKRHIFGVEEARGLMRSTIDWEFGGSEHVYALLHCKISLPLPATTRTGNRRLQARYIPVT